MTDQIAKLKMQDHENDRPPVLQTTSRFNKSSECIGSYDNGAYCKPQFLRAISHSPCAHTEAFQFTSNDNSDNDDDDDVDSTPLATATHCQRHRSCCNSYSRAWCV